MSHFIFISHVRDCSFPLHPNEVSSLLSGGAAFSIFPLTTRSDFGPTDLMMHPKIDDALWRSYQRLHNDQDASNDASSSGTRASVGRTSVFPSFRVPSYPVTAWTRFAYAYELNAQHEAYMMLYEKSALGRSRSRSQP
jgi:hypothetical protein